MFRKHSPRRDKRDVTDRKDSKPVIVPKANICTVLSPHGATLSRFFSMCGCQCVERSDPPIQGYDFIAFPAGTDYRRVKALLVQWLQTNDVSEDAALPIALVPSDQSTKTLPLVDALSDPRLTLPASTA